MSAHRSAHRKLMRVLSLTALSLFSWAAFAQQSPAPNAQPPPSAAVPLQLTLKQAVQLGLKQNPQRAIAQILVSESDRNRQIARSVLLPQAAVNGHASLDQYNLQSVEAGPRGAAGPYQIIEA